MRVKYRTAQSAVDFQSPANNNNFGIFNCETITCEGLQRRQELLKAGKIFIWLSDVEGWAPLDEDSLANSTAADGKVGYTTILVHQGTRHSDEGSADKSSVKPAGSPTKAVTETKTVALTNLSGGIHDRFPHLTDSGAEKVRCRLPPEVVDFILSHMVQQAGGVIMGSVLGTEAAYVHLARSFVMAVMTLLGPELNTRLLPDETDELVTDIAEDDSSDNNIKLAYEQWIRAGSYQGYLELQVVRNVRPGQGGLRYVGAIEVKKNSNLMSHLEQAKREAFTMWCFNAQQPMPTYEPVWVLLTNARKLMRVTYTGYNVPSDKLQAGAPAGPPVYRKKIPTKDVYGDFKYTKTYKLLDIEETQLLGGRQSEEALEVLLSGFLKPNGVPTVETLQKRLETFNESVASALGAYLEDVMALGPNKKAKHEEDKPK